MINANQAEAYDVHIVPAVTQPNATYWRAVQVRHLRPTENRGRHNVFVDAVDETGNPARDRRLRIGWTWAGRTESEAAPPQSLDKPPGEPAGNVPLSTPSQVTTVWLADPNRASDAVEGLHTNWPDEPGPGGELWNSVGHHSFYILFQLTPTGGTAPDPEEPADLETRLAAVEAWKETVTRFLRDLVGEL